MREYSEIMNEIRRLDFRNASAEELKPLYIERNTINLPVEQEIWRIFKAKNLLHDIAENIFTLPWKTGGGRTKLTN